MRSCRRTIVGAACAAALSLPTAAWAQTGPYIITNPQQLAPADVLGTDVLGNTIARPLVLGSSDAATLPATQSQTTSNGGALPVTGGDVVGLAMIGALAIGTGLVLVRRSSARPTPG